MHWTFREYDETAADEMFAALIIWSLELPHPTSPARDEAAAGEGSG